MKKDEPLNLAADIISSQLDADRLDYLLRDSHFCGVPYGNVDIEWIIKHLVTIEKTGYSPRLGIDYKGIRADEHLLLGRKLLYQNVSFHHKIRMLEQLLCYFLKSCCNASNKDKFIANKNLRTFFTNIQKHKDNHKNNLPSKESFISNNFCYYRLLTDNDIWILIKDLSEIHESDIHDDSSKIASSIAKIIYNRNLHRNFHFSKDMVGAVTRIINDICKELKLEKLEKWKLFVINKPILQYESDKDPILVENQDTVARIQYYSDLLKFMSNKNEWTSSIAISQELWNNKKVKEYIIKQLKEYIVFSKSNMELEG